MILCSCGSAGLADRQAQPGDRREKVLASTSASRKAQGTTGDAVLRVLIRDTKAPLSCKIHLWRSARYWKINRHEIFSSDDLPVEVLVSPRNPHLISDGGIIARNEMAQ